MNIGSKTRKIFALRSNFNEIFVDIRAKFRHIFCLRMSKINEGIRILVKKREKFLRYAQINDNLFKFNNIFCLSSKILLILDKEVEKFLRFAQISWNSFNVIITYILLQLKRKKQNLLSYVQPELTIKIIKMKQNILLIWIVEGG